MQLREDVVGSREETEPTSVVVVFLGIVSLVMALLSPLAIAYGQLMFAPIISLITGVVCFVLLERSRSTSILKKIVLISSAVAGITGGWSFAETKFRNDIYYSTAGKFAEQWLASVSTGQREVVFEMTINEGYRQLATMDLVDFYNSDQRARSALELFYSKAGMKAAVRRGPKAKWVYFSPRGILHTQLGDVVKVAVQDVSGTRPVSFVVSLMRSTKETVDPKLACWYVTDIEVEM